MGVGVKQLRTIVGSRFTAILHIPFQHNFIIYSRLDALSLWHTGSQNRDITSFVTYYQIRNCRTDLSSPITGNRAAVKWDSGSLGQVLQFRVVPGLGSGNCSSNIVGIFYLSNQLSSCSECWGSLGGKIECWQVSPPNCTTLLRVKSKNQQSAINWKTCKTWKFAWKQWFEAIFVHVK